MLTWQKNTQLTKIIVGTLMMIGGEAEATACENEHGICIGVMVPNAYLMNQF